MIVIHGFGFQCCFPLASQYEVAGMQCKTIFKMPVEDWANTNVSFDSDKQPLKKRMDSRGAPF